MESTWRPEIYKNIRKIEEDVTKKLQMERRCFIGKSKEKISRNVWIKSLLFSFLEDKGRVKKIIIHLSPNKKLF